MSSRKKIAKRNGGNTFFDCPLEDGSQQIFVIEIGAGPGKFDRPQRETDGGGLLPHKRSSDCMHGNAVGSRVKGGEQRGHPDAWEFREKVQGPCAVFAATPRKKNVFQIGALP